MACKAAGLYIPIRSRLARQRERAARKAAGVFLLQGCTRKSQGRRGVVLNELPKRARRARVCTRPREA